MTTADRSVEVLVVGGGVGGVAAALAASSHGSRVMLVEQTDWIGGQLTSQAVPPDEHPWIESFGCTASYRAYRDGVRRFYQQHYPLSSAAASSRQLNPGNATVSKICHEPLVSLAVLEAMLVPAQSLGNLEILRRTKPVEVEMSGDHIDAVRLRSVDGDELVVAADYVIDATETGDLLPLADLDYRIGFESSSVTGEAQAPTTAQPTNQQAFTVVFAVDHRAGEDHTIDRPANYSFWSSYQADHWPGPQLGWIAPNPRTGEPQHYQLDPNPDIDSSTIVADESRRSAHFDMWLYRRALDRTNLADGRAASDICLVNWPMNDYWLGPIVDVEAAEAEHHIEAAKELNRCLLYWMQTEAPRPDGGTGFPGLRLRPDVMGHTSDGMARAPYVRESRRIVGCRTITANDIAADGSTEPVARFDRSVGVGAYRLDLHPSTGGDPYIDLAALPFEIPLGALLPQRSTNLIAGGKNISSTHLSNGSYRLQPVEWGIGEAAGHLAAHCTQRPGTDPYEVLNVDSSFQEFESLLEAAGVETHWPEVGGY